MNQDNLKPPIDLDYESSAPHLCDYCRVVLRHIWAVLLIFAVTTAAAIWTVSRQSGSYRTQLTLQVNEPLQRSRQLTSPVARLGTQIFVDPIESEIQILLSGQISSEVVRRLGMRLRLEADSDLVRSDLFSSAFVGEDAANGGYELRYAPDGASADLVGPMGTVLGTANVGGRLDAGQVAFTLHAQPLETRTYPLEVVSQAAAAAEPRSGLSATPRRNTNLIDVFYQSPDRALAPRVLDQAAQSLQNFGARKVRRSAASDVAFVERQLDEAEAQFLASSRAIRDFQQSSAFTDLGAQGRQVVDRLQTITDDISQLELQEDALRQLSIDLQGFGIEGVDLVAFLAVLPEEINPQLRTLVGEIQDRRDEAQRLLTEEGKTLNHPEVKGVIEQVRSRESELEAALEQNLLRISQDLAVQSMYLAQIQSRQSDIPGLRNELEALEVERTSDMETVRFLKAQIYQARIVAASAEPYVDIVDPASPAFSVRPRAWTNTALGALLGLMLGIGAAFFLEYLDRTVRTRADVETLLGIPVLGIIPKLRSVSDGEPVPASPDVPMLVAMDPLDPATESYRSLRMNLVFTGTDDRPVGTLLFSSPGPSEGKTTTALNLGIMLAQQGRRVLMIDADLRRPSIHKALGLFREPGLTNLLVGDSDVRDTLRLSVLPNFDVLPSGPFPPNPSELLNSNALGRLLESFREDYDEIIIDSPPVLAVTDAALVGQHADATVLVLRSGETEQRAAERAVDQLSRIGVRVLGAVLNDVAAGSHDDSYYLQYYYAYRPETPVRGSRLREELSKARFW